MFALNMQEKSTISTFVFFLMGWERGRSENSVGVELVKKGIGVVERGEKIAPTSGLNGADVGGRSYRLEWGRGLARQLEMVDRAKLTRAKSDNVFSASHKICTKTYWRKLEFSVYNKNFMYSPTHKIVSFNSLAFVSSVSSVLGHGNKVTSI